MGLNLFQRVCEPKNLEKAWLNIKAKGSRGGIDHVETDVFEKNAAEELHLLHMDLIGGTYKPDPGLSLRLKKEGKNETRPLGLLTIRDKIAQLAVKQIIEPIIDKQFSPASYGYRPGRSPLKAINKTKHLIQFEKRYWMAVCDIDNFFDTIPIGPLQDEFNKRFPDPKLCRLVETWAQMGKVTYSYHWEDRLMGVQQGSVLSPLLSNMYLDGFDHEMQKRNYGLVRFADDFVILCHNARQAKAALDFAVQYLDGKLKLKLNQGYKVQNTSEGFDFLGLHFLNHQVTVSAEKQKKLVDRLVGSLGFSDEGFSDGFHQAVNGFQAYYHKLLPQHQLKQIDMDFQAGFVRFVAKEKSGGRKLNKTFLKKSIENLPFFSKYCTDAKPYILNQLLAQCQGLMVSGSSPAQKPAGLVRSRKREYEKLESAGFEMVVKSPGVYIGIANGKIIARRQKEVLLKAGSQLKNISVLTTAVSFSGQAIQYCAEHGVSVDFMGFDGKPYAMLVAPQYPDARTSLAQVKALKDETGQRWAARVIYAKLQNQANLMKYYAKYHHGKDNAFTSVFEKCLVKMEGSADAALVFSGRDANNYREQIMAIEAHGADNYWQMVKALLDGYIAFPSRIHRGATDPVNCMLNYGYGMLYARVWEALIKARLNPCIGYIHANEPNRPALVYDFIEQFRQQAVDRPVFGILAKGEAIEIKEGRLSEATRDLLVDNIFERLNKLELYRGKRQRFTDIMEHQARETARFFNGEVKTYKPYIAKW